MSEKYLFTQTICPINIFTIYSNNMSDKYLFQTICPNNMSDKYLFTQTICPINIYLLKQYVR